MVKFGNTMKYFITTLIVFAIYSCGNSRLTKDSKSIAYIEGDLEIVASYIQTEFAGEAEEENKSWITIVLNKENFTEFTLDSMVFKPNDYQLAEEFKGFTIRNNQTRLLLKSTSSKNKLAQFSSILYYHKGNKVYRQNLLSVELKEPLYLP
jgi:hypothetical protein